MKVAVFTICARNYLAYARTLMESVERQHPEFERILVLSDRLEGRFDPAAEAFEVVEAGDLGIEDLAAMAFRYNVTEFATAIKPAAFRHVFDRWDCDAVVYLDPDIYLVSPMAELLDGLREGDSAVLTPHICAPIEDGQKPDDHSMLQSGIYNLGFLALANDPEARRFVSWWHRKLVRDCRIDLEEGLFVDQKWADLLPCFVERTRILRHPGYNVAYWNLMHRKVAQVDGRWTANDAPLRFVHFSGVESPDPEVFSKHQERFSASTIGELGILLDEYRRRVDRAGRRQLAGESYAFGIDSEGRPIPDLLRRIYREELESSRSLDEDPAGAARAYCNEPSRAVPQHPGRVVTRIMARVWESRPDLQEAFDLRTADGNRGFTEWFLHSAGRELGLDEEFTRAVRPAAAPEPPRPDAAVRGERRAAPPAVDRSWLQRVAMGALSNAYRLKRFYLRVPVPVRRRVKTTLLRTAYRPALPRSSRASRSAPAPAGVRRSFPIGARLIGYPRAELGMGEHVRLSAVALDAIKFPFALYDFSANVVARQQDDRFVSWLDNEATFNVNLFHINADQMQVVRDTLGEDFFAGRHNVGYWAWELSRFPAAWRGAIEMVDEVWAPSRFVQESISKTADRPVVWMPIAVQVSAPPSIDRSYFHLPEDRFIFLFSFDFSSYATRKNPRAVMEAFQRAFDRDRRDVLLLIKTMAQDWHQEELAALRAEVAEDPRMRLLDAVLSPREIAGLVNCCDSYVSLHRSEGFGRGMAEAMALGKPVIATNYSGNTDFMTESTSCLVDYQLVPVAEGEYPHHEDQVWADPDVDQAADAMRKLVLDPVRSRLIGARARRHIEQGWGPAAVGTRMLQRLKDLGLT
ncbi:MAG: glycosyltransferase [Myxococcota bacterium]